MTTTFLHDDKLVSPDDIGGAPPTCENCGTEMWLTVVDKTISDRGIDGTYRYECKTCGAITKKATRELTI